MNLSRQVRVFSSPYIIEHHNIRQWQIKAISTTPFLKKEPNKVTEQKLSINLA